MTTLSLRTATHNPYLTPETLLGAALILYASVGVASFYWLGYLVSMVAVYFVGRMNLSDRGLWAGIGAIYVLLLSTILNWAPYGGFGNPNVMGCLSALVLAGCLVFHLWAFLPFALFGLWFADSRTGMVAAAVAVGLWIWRKERIVAYAFLLACLAGALAYKGQTHIGSFAHRLGIWHDALEHLTPFGAGLGSFFEDYKSWVYHINMDGWATHAYNDFLELTHDLGIGVVFLWFFIALHLESPDWRNKLIFFIFVTCGLTFFPAYLPGLGHIGALTLGRLYYGKMAARSPALHQRAGN